MSNVFLLFICV